LFSTTEITIEICEILVKRCWGPHSAVVIFFDVFVVVLDVDVVMIGNVMMCLI
jgi:hypothetical protein